MLKSIKNSFTHVTNTMRSSRVTIIAVILIASCILLYLVLWFVANPFGPKSGAYYEPWASPYSANWSSFSHPLRSRRYSRVHRYSRLERDKRIRNPVPDDIVTEIDLNANAIAINALQTKWHETFFNVFITNEFQSLFPDTKSTVLANNDEIKQLLIETQTFFVSSLDITQSKQFILSNHRSIIVIRRYVMILYESFTSHKITFNQTLYESLIHDVFIPIRIKYTNIMQNEYAKAWFLIHISKSAGSTVCATQKYVGYQQLLYSGTNCNIEFHGAPIKNPDEGVFSCAQIEAIQRAGDTEFLSSERPMTGHGTSNKPTLCDKYHYILPVRHPLSRVASTVNEYRLDKLYFPFEILIRKEGNVTLYFQKNNIRYTRPRRKRGSRRYKRVRKRHSRKLNAQLLLKSSHASCPETVVTIDTETFYAPLNDQEDFMDFVSHLFENEKETDDMEEKKWQNNFRCQQRTNLDHKEQTRYRYDDMTYLTYLGEDKKYAIKTTEGFKHRSNVALMRGYCSNINTRWIGYQRKEGGNASYDAIFEKSYNINVTHWVNAVEFMMRTDYVMPFESKFEHDIWKFTLKDLWDFVPSGYRDNSDMRRRLRGRLGNKAHQETVHRARAIRKIRNSIKEDESAAKANRHRKIYTLRHGRSHQLHEGLRYKRKSMIMNGKFRNPGSMTEWAHSHVASDSRYHVSTQTIMSVWTDEEKEFIMRKNLLDVQLFKMAMWIAQVDVTFYEDVDIYRQK
eukprot:508701_1